VLEWYQGLPESLKFNATDLARENEIPSRGRRRLRLLFHLRKNQARISLYRPILHSATSIMESRHYAQNAIDVAKNTITTLTSMNQISDIYRIQQVLFNYFLVQALAVIFLAVAHAPAIFVPQTRQEFYSAIDLIKGFSTKSYISKRLWRTIRGLKDMGEKLGMSSRGHAMNEQEHDAHSDAAVTMAGLAGHKVDNYSILGTNPHGHQDIGASPDDAQQMTNELTTLFEMAGGYGNAGGLGNDTFDGFGANGDVGAEAFSYFGNEPEFARIMNELF